MPTRGGGNTEGKDKNLRSEQKLLSCRDKQSTYFSEKSLPRREVESKLEEGEISDSSVSLVTSNSQLKHIEKLEAILRDEKVKRLRAEQMLINARNLIK